MIDKISTITKYLHTLLKRTYIRYMPCEKETQCISTHVSLLNPLRLILIIFVYLSSLPVAHLSDAPPPPRKRLVVTGDSGRTKLLRIPPGSLTCSVYSTVSSERLLIIF